MTAELAFTRFVRTGEPAALGEVFDLVADELFGVALHLTSSRAAAEDLVQATFLAAMRRASRWDPQRPLRPWLLGLLRKEAQVAWRRERRRVDRERLAPQPPATPVDALLAAEARAALAGAVATLPQPYRAVVELRLHDGLAPDAIARRLSRSPGAVRTQLWRALEMLRSAMPRGLAPALAATVGADVALAAVRRRVLEAAAARTAASAGTLLIAGALMKTRVLAVTAIAVIATVAWFAWPEHADPRDRELRSPRPAARRLASTVGFDTEPEVAPARLERRGVADTEADPPVAEPTEDARTLHDEIVLVVDRDGLPVANAEVCVYEAGESHGPRPPRPPIRTTHTDARGHATLPALSRGECFVSALHAEIGASGDVRVRVPMSDRTRRLVLQKLIRVTGTVVDADGEPVSGAQVHCGENGTPWQWLRTEPPPPPTTTSDGRFAFDLVPGVIYEISAHHASRRSGSVEVDTWREPAEPREREIELRLPETRPSDVFRLSGLLLGPDGRASSGHVHVTTDEARAWLASSDVEPDGRFVLELDRGGPLRVFGGVEGTTPASVAVELDRHQPRAELTLRTMPLAHVAGQVVDEHGEPLPDLRICISYPDEHTSPLQRAVVRVAGRLDRGATAADGSFRLLAPAGYPWAVACELHPRFWAERAICIPPVHDVIVRITEADRRGFVAEGQVVDARTRHPIERFSLGVVTRYPWGAGESPLPDVADADGRFRIGPLRTLDRGWHYEFVFEADGYAPAVLGPFDGTPTRQVALVAMQRPGRLHCRVRYPHGAPAAVAQVHVIALPRIPFAANHQRPTDAQGEILFESLPVGRANVFAFAPGYLVPHPNEVLIRPGELTELALVLGAPDDRR